jgi:DHA1 family tetracycline resistance protein-like MFS transporter
VNFLFAFLFLPETTAHTNRVIQKSASSDGYWRRLGAAITKPLIGTVLAILFIITFAFSAVPVIMPLLGIEFFGFGEVEMSYFFMYIGLVQIVLQGVLIGRLTKRLGENNLIVLGSLIMTLGIFTISLFSNIAVFLVSLTMMSSGMGMLGTVLPSFISKRAPADEQGGMLGVAQAVGRIARIPGPLFGGFIAEFAGLNAAFFVTTFIVSVALVLGFTVFRNHKLRGKHAEAVNVQTVE